MANKDLFFRITCRHTKDQEHRCLSAFCIDHPGVQNKIYERVDYALKSYQVVSEFLEVPLEVTPEIVRDIIKDTLGKLANEVRNETTKRQNLL